MIYELLTGYNPNIRTDKSITESQSIEIDYDVHDAENLESLYSLSESEIFKAIKYEPYIYLFRRIESFLTLQTNWDGNGAIPVTKRVVEQSKKIIEHLNYAYVSEMKINQISATPYSTIVIDWEKDNEKELSLEIGKDAIGYYYENNDEYKEVESLNVNNSNDFKDAIKFVEEDLSKLF